LYKFLFFASGICVTKNKTTYVLRLHKVMPPLTVTKTSLSIFHGTQER